MTDTAMRSAMVPGPVPAHPLDPVSAEEFLAGRRILADAGLLTANVRFAYYGLEEPPKDEVLGLAGRAGVPSDRPGGGPPDRRLRAFLIDVVSGESSDVVVSLTDGKVTSRRALDPLVDGQVPILDQDFALAEKVVHADPEWRAAMARRGLTDVSKIRACPLTAGSYGVADEQRRRMVRVLAFLQEGEHDLAWAHPVDGVAAYVDLIEGRVFKVIDELVLPVPRESGDYDDPAVSGPPRTTLKPIEITQPEGPSFTLAGNAVEWQNYSDSGEYLVGKWANSLELGCDRLGEIAYLDATVTDDQGEPRVIRNAICIHEEDFGILWKHTDIFNGSAQSRRQRRLVVSFFTTVGNYDYGFYWYFYLDGTIECEVKLTGVLFTSAYPGQDHPYATEVAPGLGAPAHQHLFSARLDMMVDGPANAVEEIDVQGCAVGPENTFGNALVQTVTRLGRESEAGRRAAPERDRIWRIINPEVTNRFGRPVGFTLYPQAAPTLLADPGSSLYARAIFATNHLWVTRYDPAHRYPAGDFVNQHPGGAGIPAFIAGDQDIDGADVVLWHTFGSTHFPRPEDWPVMPVSRCGFSLKPTGFFGRNPTLDVPPPLGAHCGPGAS